MAVLVVGAETTLAALHPRLFGGRRVSADTAKRVADALRKANREVDLDALRPGTVLVVPDLEGVSLDAELSLGAGADQALAAVRAAIAGTLDDVAGEAFRREAEDAGGRRWLAETLRSQQVKRAVEGQPLLAAQLERTLRLVAEADAGAEGRAAAISAAHDDWAAELATLKRLMP